MSLFNLSSGRLMLMTILQLLSWKTFLLDINVICFVLVSVLY